MRQLECDYMRVAAHEGRWLSDVLLNCDCREVEQEMRVRALRRDLSTILLTLNSSGKPLDKHFACNLGFLSIFRLRCATEDVAY